MYQTKELTILMVLGIMNVSGKGASNHMVLSIMNVSDKRARISHSLGYHEHD